MNSDPIILAESLFKMERDYRLFHLKTVDNIPLWDIIRHYCWENVCKIGTEPIPKTRPSNLIYLLIFFRSLYTIPKLLFYKSPVFFIGASKFSNSDGAFIDMSFEMVKSSLKEKYLFIELICGQKKYLKSRRVFSLLELLKFVNKYLLFNKFVKYNVAENDEANILNAINETFGPNVFSREDITNSLIEFRIEYFYWNILMQWKKCHTVYFIRHGYQKGLIYASKMNKVRTIEFQHGDIAETTLIYNYNELESKTREMIISPDLLLSYSDIWTNNRCIPSKCIEIGSPEIPIETQNAVDTNILVIISSDYQGKNLEELTIKLAQTTGDFKIYYKLHPNQFYDIERHKKLFKPFFNIQVISNELNISDLLKISNEFVAIYSTAIYKIVQAGKLLYQYKRQDYTSFNSYNYLPGVFLFDDVEDFLSIRHIAKLTAGKYSSPRFFKPFNKKNFLKAIEISFSNDN